MNAPNAAAYNTYYCSTKKKKNGRSARIAPQWGKTNNHYSSTKPSNFRTFETATAIDIISVHQILKDQFRLSQPIERKIEKSAHFSGLSFWQFLSLRLSYVEVYQKAPTRLQAVTAKSNKILQYSWIYENTA